MLLHDGYASMTVTSLAAAAGVSPQTVYNSVGNKAAVVKAVYDQMMAGDDAEVPMSDRPEFRAMFDSVDRPAFARAYAAWIRVLSGRAGPLLGALLAHGTDATLLEFMATIEQERYVGTTHAITGMRDRIGLPEQSPDEHGLHRLIDAVWTLNSPDCYDRLVRRRGWSPAEYEAWLAGQLIALFG
ncbi:TetR family transcriptional regulator [Nocardioides sp. Root151]|nr:TetR family transcriptional regulator [Nocardioides sp. Root140]KQZ68993.1 TetR family transcriptional regulator [Nocardioides sp. Root151]KRF20505.1 TetR family transcriptional regulator [Nocardioides sp. Soil796]